MYVKKRDRQNSLFGKDQALSNNSLKQKKKKGLINVL